MTATELRAVKGRLTHIPVMEIDPSKIGNVSLHKWNIELPYGDDGAMLRFVVRPFQRENIRFIPAGGDKRHTYQVDATPAEIEDVLYHFFFDERGRTRAKSCGLTEYWLGHWQADFDTWRRLKHGSYVFGLYERLSDEERDCFRRLQDAPPIP